MTFGLAKDVEDFLQIRAVAPDLEAWLLEAADKSVTPLISDDFDGIRDRVRMRLGFSLD